MNGLLYSEVDGFGGDLVIRRYRPQEKQDRLGICLTRREEGAAYQTMNLSEK